MIEKNYHKGFTYAAWVDWALNKDTWFEYECINIDLDTPQSFNDARDVVERMIRDGWNYDGVGGEGDVFLCFFKEPPVTNEEREQAREWLEKYSDRV